MCVNNLNDLLANLRKFNKITNDNNDVCMSGRTDGL